MTQCNHNEDYFGSKSGDMIQNLLKENTFLLKLVDTIPPKMYFDNEVQKKIISEKHLKMDQNAQSLKRSSSKAKMSVKNKHKRARLDPQYQKSVSQVQKELSSKKVKRSKDKSILQPSPSLSRAENIEELQKRLQERISEFHTKRKFVPGNNPKSKKKKEKKDKKAKVVVKQIKETEMQTKKPSKHKSSTESAPSYNKEGKIIYSKLNFSENGLDPTDKKKSEFSGKDYKRLLKKAEKKKEKLDSLKAVDPEKAALVDEKEKWKKAILRSENVKVKDDVELLKKSAKKQEKRKQKKAKEWKDRTEHVEYKKEAHQKKRARNIQKKKKEKLDKKIKHAKKKGRVIPGF